MCQGTDPLNAFAQKLAKSAKHGTTLAFFASFCSKGSIVFPVSLCLCGWLLWLDMANDDYLMIDDESSASASSRPPR
jgi:hypothetical protein